MTGQTVTRINRGFGASLQAIALVALLVPGTALAQSRAASNGEVTFTRDVAPILQQNCQLCHQPGSIAPMSLMTYEEVRPWAPMIKQQVVSRNMPPYHYDPRVGIQELKDDRRLSDEEIATIARWVDTGTPQGNPADMPPPVAFPNPDEWGLAASLGQPDVVLASTPFKLAAGGGDIWPDIEVPTGFTEDRCIKAIEVKPARGSRAAVHHAIPAFEVQQPDGTWRNFGTLTEYAVGKMGELIPADGCRVAPKNSRISWGNHYYPIGEEVDVVVEVALWLYPKGTEPKHRQTLALYALERQGGGPVLDIAPHSYAMTQGFFSWPTPVRIDSFMPHGHFRMRAKWMELYNPETRERKLLSMVSTFNPGWQNSYTYQDHVAPLVPKGSVIIITAVHDNTANNPHNPDPDQWVNRGSRTTDEMSQAWLAVTHLDEERFTQLLQERKAREETLAQQAARDD